MRDSLGIFFKKKWRGGFFVERIDQFGACVRERVSVCVSILTSSACGSVTPSMCKQKKGCMSACERDSER